MMWVLLIKCVLSVSWWYGQVDTWNLQDGDHWWENATFSCVRTNNSLITYLHLIYLTATAHPFTSHLSDCKYNFELLYTPLHLIYLIEYIMFKYIVLYISCIRLQLQCWTVHSTSHVFDCKKYIFGLYTPLYISFIWWQIQLWTVCSSTSH